MTFDEMITELSKISASDAHNRPVLNETIRCLKEYLDPWICPDCLFTAKIPPNKKQPNICPKCKKDAMMPYGYKEHHRLSFQINKLLRVVKTYAAWPIIGRPARQVLIDVFNVPRPTFRKNID